MNRHRIVFSLFMVVPITGIPAQSSQESLSLKTRVERGLQHSDLQAFLDAAAKGPAEANEVDSAIIAGGRTNDPFWVPYLKPFLKYSRNRYREMAALADAAQLALANSEKKRSCKKSVARQISAALQSNTTSSLTS